MPTTTEHQLKITADAREVKKLGQTISQSLDKRTVKEFERANKDLEGQLTRLTRKQIEVTRALEGVKRGTAAYKSLGKELRSVRREADMVQKSMGQIDRLMRKQEQDQKRRRGFVAGLAQGAGIAQYIPSEPGMGRRIAGAAIGGAARRGIGAAAAPFTTPGIAGVATGLQGIPIVGGFLAGALQQAAGAYQAAVGYDRSRIANIHFADMTRVRHRGRGPTAGQTAAVQAAQAQIQAAQRGAGPVTQVSMRRWDADNPPPAILRRDSVNAVNRLLSGEAQKGAAAAFLHSATGKRNQVMIENDRKMRAYRLRRSGTEATAKEADIKAAQGRLAAAKQAIESSKRNRASMIGLGRVGLGAELGFGPTQVQGMMGQFFGARGGIFNQTLMNQAMAAQVRFGVGMQQSGQMARMQMAGGGGTANVPMARVLYSAVLQGLRGSQVTEYLQTLVGLGQQAEKMGVKINVREFVKSSAQLTAVGLQGLQAQRVAGGLQQAGMRVSQRGVQGPLDVIMARAAGFDPSQGAEGYARAMNRLAGGMTSETMNNLLGMVTKGAGAGGFGPEMQRMLVRRAMAKMGVQVGPGQASAMLESYKAGKRVDVDALVAGEGSQRKMQREARMRVRALAPTAPGAAAMEAQRIGVGRGAAAWVVQFEANALKAAGVINNFSGDLIRLSGAVNDFMGMVNKWTKGGTSGVAERLWKGIMPSWLGGD